MKWIVAFLAMLVASTAQAAVTVTTGTIIPTVTLPLTFETPHEIWTFRILDPLPDGVYVSTPPPPNQWFIWSADRSELLAIDSGDAMPGLVMTPLAVTKQSWTYDLQYTDRSTIGVAWWNDAWYPVGSDGFWEVRYEFVVETLPPVPEPATWLMMILGFGMIGLAYRRRRRAACLAFYDAKPASPPKAPRRRARA